MILHTNNFRCALAKAIMVWMTCFAQLLKKRHFSKNVIQSFETAFAVWSIFAVEKLLKLKTD